MSIGWAIALAAVLLLVNAAFVAGEFAVTSARRSQVEPLVEEGRAGAKDALAALERVSEMLAVCQLGVTLCSTGLGMVAEPAIARLVERPLVALGLPAASAHVAGFLVALLLVVFLHVVVGEMIPKNLSITSPDRAILLLGPGLLWLARALRPIVRGLDSLANLFLRLGGIEPKSEVAATFTAEEVASILEVSKEEGVLEADLGLLSGSLEFTSANVTDVMVGIDSLLTLPAEVSPAEIERMVARTGFSRFPVTNANEELVGYVHLKDAIQANPVERDEPMSRWRIRRLIEVCAGDEVEDALAKMQSSGAHLALVRAEVAKPGKGKAARRKRKKTPVTVGVIFLEDILEELVGEVRDSMQRGQQ